MIRLAGGVLAASAVVIGVLRWEFSVVTVHGPSMEPELADGDQVLARRCGLGHLRPGHLVLFREPGLHRRRRAAWLTGAGQDCWVIKRVAAIPGDPVPETVRVTAGVAAVVPARALVVLGDAPSASRDSRLWGFIPASQILGVVVRRPPPPSGEGAAQSSADAA